MLCPSHPSDLSVNELLQQVFDWWVGHHSPPPSSSYQIREYLSGKWLSSSSTELVSRITEALLAPLTGPYNMCFFPPLIGHLSVCHIPISTWSFIWNEATFSQVSTKMIMTFSYCIKRLLAKLSVLQLCVQYFKHALMMLSSLWWVKEHVN